MFVFKCTGIDPKDNGSHRVRLDPVEGAGRVQIFTDEETANTFEVGKVYSLSFKEVKVKNAKTKKAKVQTS